MRERLENWHRRLVTQGPTALWERFVFATLVVLSLLYGTLLWLRERFYFSGVIRRYRAPIPVISVGNLTVGGTGKTPVTDMLVKRVLELGLKPAVVSRGYGREVSAPVEIVSKGEGPQLSPRAAGDEPYLLARRNPQAIVVVAAKRSAGIAQAVALGAEVAILDDGFQHLAVERDLDIVLLDAHKPLGNGLPLPAGVLREFPMALKRASLICTTRSKEQRGAELLWGKPVVATQHRLADSGWDLSGKLWNIPSLQGEKVGAFCGIASPDSFFTSLRALGVELYQTLALPDHVCYDSAAMLKLRSFSSALDLLVTTEKDAVKLLEVDLAPPCVAMPLELEIVENRERLDAVIQQCLATKETITMSLSNELLEILACPACKGPVELQRESQEILCTTCKLAYPVRDDIPVLLIDEARKLSGGG